MENYSKNQQKVITTESVDNIDKMQMEQTCTELKCNDNKTKTSNQKDTNEESHKLGTIPKELEKVQNRELREINVFSSIFFNFILLGKKYIEQYY